MKKLILLNVFICLLCLFALGQTNAQSDTFSIAFTAKHGSGFPTDPGFVATHNERDIVVSMLYDAVTQFNLPSDESNGDVLLEFRNMDHSNGLLERGLYENAEREGLYNEYAGLHGLSFGYDGKACGYGGLFYVHEIAYVGGQVRKAAIDFSCDSGEVYGTLRFNSSIKKDCNYEHCPKLKKFRVEETSVVEARISEKQRKTIDLLMTAIKRGRTLEQQKQLIYSLLPVMEKYKTKLPEGNKRDLAVFLHDTLRKEAQTIIDTQNNIINSNPYVQYLRRLQARENANLPVVWEMYDSMNAKLYRIQGLGMNSWRGVNYWGSRDDSIKALKTIIANVENAGAPQGDEALKDIVLKAYQGILSVLERNIYEVVVLFEQDNVLDEGKMIELQNTVIRHNNDARQVIKDLHEMLESYAAA